MDGNSLNRMLAISCTVALASVVSACNADRTSSNQGAPIKLTGCLQKSGGLTSSYVLTQVNEPTRSVGTSGSSQPDVVKQEQMREAKHSYRLDGDDDQLSNLVGKQVRVEGTVAENSDLNKRAAEDRKDTDKPADIDTGDLAKVKVNSISAMSDSCGSSPTEPPKP